MCLKTPKSCNLDVFEVQIVESYLLTGGNIPFDHTLVDHSLNKVCTACHTIKSNDMFRDRINKSKTGTYSNHVCRPCESSYSLEYNNSHIEAQQDYQLSRTISGADAAMRRKHAEESLQLHLLRKAKHNSQQRGYDFNLEISDIIIPILCPLLKIPLQVNIGKGMKQDDSYSIDRIDSTKGYVRGNVQILSSLANTMKNSATKEQLITFAKSVLEIYKDEDIV